MDTAMAPQLAFWALSTPFGPLFGAQTQLWWRLRLLAAAVFLGGLAVGGRSSGCESRSTFFARPGAAVLGAKPVETEENQPNFLPHSSIWQWISVNGKGTANMS